MYTHGFYSCCGDCGKACCACFLPWCAAANVFALSRGEPCSLCHWFALHWFARANVKHAIGMPDSLDCDCCSYFFCPVCSITQDWREIEHIKRNTKGPVYKYVTKDNNLPPFSYSIQEHSGTDSRPPPPPPQQQQQQQYYAPPPQQQYYPQQQQQQQYYPQQQQQQQQPPPYYPPPPLPDQEQQYYPPPQ